MNSFQHEKNIIILYGYNNKNVFQSQWNHIGWFLKGIRYILLYHWRWKKLGLHDAKTYKSIKLCYRKLSRQFQCLVNWIVHICTSLLWTQPELISILSLIWRNLDINYFILIFDFWKGHSTKNNYFVEKCSFT